MFKRRGWRGITRRGLAGLDECCNVELLLLRSAGVGVTVFLAPLVATLPAAVRSAAKGTAEILPVLVAGMCEEANPAVAAVYRAALKTRTNAQGGIQRALILTNKRTGAVVLVPILAKREDFRDGYSKTARFSVKMLICFCISSSYSLDAKTSRGRARIFCA